MREDGVSLMRAFFLSFIVGGVLVGAAVVVLEFYGELVGTTSQFPVAVGVVVWGLVGFAVPTVLDRPLSCEGDAELAKSYVQRFFLHIAFAESAALAGFLGFIFTGAGWLYPLGAVFTAIGFSRMAPTATKLEHAQAELHGAGCHRSLLAALQQHGFGRQ